MWKKAQIYSPEALFERLKKKGYTIVASGSVGSVKSIAARLIFWKVFEPFIKSIDEIWCESGSTFVDPCIATGMSESEIRAKCFSLMLKDVVVDRGVLRAIQEILQHFSEYRGIDSGDLMKYVLAKTLPSDNFYDASPKLRIVASKLNGIIPTVFSENTNPPVKISDAAVASSAIKNIIAPQVINGEEYIDAAEYEPIPLRTVLEEHIKNGGDPRKLFIIGTFIHSFPREAPRPGERDYFKMQPYFSSFQQLHYYRSSRREVALRGVKTLIFEFDATKVVIPNDSFTALPLFGKGIRTTKKILGRITKRRYPEKLLKGITDYFDRELNPQHIHYYCEAFENGIDKKIKDNIEKFMKEHKL